MVGGATTMQGIADRALAIIHNPCRYMSVGQLNTARQEPMLALRHFRQGIVHHTGKDHDMGITKGRAVMIGDMVTGTTITADNFKK